MAVAGYGDLMFVCNRSGPDWCLRIVTRGTDEVFEGTYGAKAEVDDAISGRLGAEDPNADPVLSWADPFDADHT
jgi:hypothetical protein